MASNEEWIKFGKEALKGALIFAAGLGIGTLFSNNNKENINSQRISELENNNKNILNAENETLNTNSRIHNPIHNGVVSYPDNNQRITRS